MSCAGVTVTLLPVLDANAAAASVTALVSASPEEAIRTCRFAGPADFCGAAFELLKLLPHAALASTRAVAANAKPPRRSRLVMGVVPPLGGDL